MDASNPIILYDIPSPHPDKAWSPNTWKTRYCLNYKRLQYRTEWVEMPDLESLYAKLDLPAVPMHTNVTYHSVPIITDPSTGRTISESLDIVRYLDETYPSTPRLIPEGNTMLIHGFAMLFAKQTFGHLVMLIMSECKLNEASLGFYEKTRPAYFGVPTYADLKLTGEARRKEVESLKAGLDGIAKLYEVNGKGEYVMGERLSYADVVVAAMLKWWSLNLPEWEEVKGWNGGRWARALELMDEKYGQVL